MELYLFSIPEIYLISTDGEDKQLNKQIINFNNFSYSKTSSNTYQFSGTIPNTTKPINDGHYELSLLTSYGTEKYHFFVQTHSLINNHYFRLTERDWDSGLVLVKNDLNELREVTKESIDKIVDLLTDVDENNDKIGIPEVMEVIHKDLGYEALKSAIGVGRVGFGGAAGLPEIGKVARTVGLTVKQGEYLDSVYKFLKSSGLVFDGVTSAEDLYEWLGNHEEIFASGNKEEVRTTLRNYLENEAKGFLDSQGNSLSQKGTKGIKMAIDEKFDSYISSLGEELPKDYPVDIVHKKLQALKQEIIKARMEENMLSPLNDSILPSTFILGDPIEFSKAFEKQVKRYIIADKVQEVSFWAGTGLFGANMFVKGVSLIISGGWSIWVQVPLAIGYFTADATHTVTGVMNWSAEKAIGKNVGLFLVSGINEIAELRAVSVDTLSYLEELEERNWSDVNIDNNQIQIDSFEMDDAVIWLFDETVSVGGRIRITNNGPDTVPVITYVEVFKSMDINGKTDNSPIMVSTSDWHNLPANSSTNLDIKPITLMGSEKLGTDSYIAKAYVIAGPSIISRKADLITDEFYVDSYLITARKRNTESIGDGLLNSGEMWEELFSPIIAPFKPIFQDITLWFGGSDLDLHVYDSLGRHVGMNYETGQIEIEIPGAIYSGSDSNPEVIRLPNQEGETYTIKVKAIQASEEEPFEVTVSYIPEREAILAVAPNSIRTKINLREESKIDFIISAKEIGGQKDYTDLTINVTDLASESFTIPSSNINIDIPSLAIPAGSSIDIPVTIDIPSDIPLGTYSGEITLTATTGSGTTDSIILPIEVTVCCSCGILGDVNEDCIVNILDLIFVRNRLNKNVRKADNRKADVNKDEKINILDLIAVRNSLGTRCLDGDVNNDCLINILDLIFIRARLNQNINVGDNWKADVNGDNKINILDLIFVRDHLNTKCER